jgi:histidinol phosphatase-like enzyme
LRTELTRVRARIKARAQKTVSNGCTEAEAMAAAEMVSRLLERYALSIEGAVRVADRLDDLLGARDASVAAQRSTGTSLIMFAQAQGMVDAI